MKRILFKKKLKTAGQTFLGILAGVSLTVCVLRFAGIRTYLVRSGSMEPAVHTGSVCLVDTRVAYDDIRTGEIVAYRSKLGGLVTHRVIAVTGEGLETKGDANDLTDGIAVTAENYLGRTCFVFPGCVSQQKR